MRLKSNCRLCACGCGTEIELKNGKIASVRGDADSFSGGFICRRAESLNTEREFSQPLIKNSDGSFRKVSWEEAFDYTAEKLKKTVSENPEALAVHTGESYYNNDFSDTAKNFLNALGSPNFSDGGSYCNLARESASLLLHGNPAPRPDFKNADTVVLWGSNPKASAPRYAEDMRQNLDSGAKLVVIDPSENRLAEEADLYLQIRPGTDGALALGILNILFERGAVDEDYWMKNSKGFSEFREYVKQFDVINTQIITWIDGEKIEALADIYENSESLASSIGAALEHQTNAVQSIRAVMTLDILSGFLGKKGGSLVLPDSGFKRIPLKTDKDAVGQKEFPILRKYFGIAQAVRYQKAVLEGIPYKLKAMIVHESNPALTFPNSNETVKALKNLDFLAVFENRITETAELADIVFPRTCMYERDSALAASASGKQHIMFTEKISEPEIMTEFDVFAEIAKRLGIYENMEFKTYEDILKYRVSDTELDFENKSFSYSEEIEEDFEFLTDSGKLEIYSEELKSLGLEPLVKFEEPAESMLTNTPNAEYIFTATTGARASNSKISREDDGIRTVRADKAVLKKFHKEDGDRVIISSPRGSMEAVIELTDRLCPNTLSIPQSDRNHNPNSLVDSEVLDPAVGYAGSRSFLIKLDHSH